MTDFAIITQQIKAATSTTEIKSILGGISALADPTKSGAEVLRGQLPI